MANRCATPRADLLRCYVSKLPNPFFRSPHTSSRPMFTRGSRFYCPPESARICSDNGKQYQIAVSDLPFPAPNSTIANLACRPPKTFPPTRSRGCHPACCKHEGQAECQHANAPPRQVPGRVVIGPSIAPRLPSQHCGQCRHHQGQASPHTNRIPPFNPDFRSFAFRSTMGSAHSNLPLNVGVGARAPQ